MIDKIFELICEEARRRTGKDLVSKIYQVSCEVDSKVLDFMLSTHGPRGSLTQYKNLPGKVPDDTKIK